MGQLAPEKTAPVPKDLFAWSTFTSLAFLKADLSSGQC